MARIAAPRATLDSAAIRTSAQLLGQTASLDIDGAWLESSEKNVGPIDVIDMFSGCGGMSAGFHAINGLLPSFNLAAAVDIDKKANITYEHNLGVRPICADISGMSRSKRQLDDLVARTRSRKKLVLIGCAPCQGFSSHRNKSGQTDQRNNLFLDFARIAKRLQPAAVVIENVPELLSDRYWHFIAEARSMLESSGYFVHLAAHNLAEFGVPQERFRAILIAMKKPFSSPIGFLSRNEFRTVRHAIGGLAPVAAGVRDPSDEMHYSAGHKASTIETIRAVPADGGNRPYNVGPACLRTSKSWNGKPAYEDVYGRLPWDKPSITITAYARNPASGRFVHPVQHRALTIREAAILQGFPADFWFNGSLDEAFRQIGNAVPPRFAAYIAAHVLGELLGRTGSELSFDRGITAPVGPSFSRLIPSLKAGTRKAVGERVAQVG